MLPLCALVLFETDYFRDRVNVLRDKYILGIEHHNPVGAKWHSEHVHQISLLNNT